MGVILEMVLKVGHVDGENCYFRKFCIFGVHDHVISDIWWALRWLVVSTFLREVNGLQTNTNKSEKRRGRRRRELRIISTNYLVEFSNIQSLHWTRVYSLVDFPQDNGEYPQCRHSTHYTRADTCLKPRCTNHLQHCGSVLSWMWWWGRLPAETKQRFTIDLLLLCLIREVLLSSVGLKTCVWSIVGDILGVLLQLIKINNIITLLMVCISVEQLVTVFWIMKSAGRLTVVYLLDLEEMNVGPKYSTGDNLGLRTHAGWWWRHYVFLVHM